MPSVARTAGDSDIAKLPRHTFSPIQTGALSGELTVSGGGGASLLIAECESCASGVQSEM